MLLKLFRMPIKLRLNATNWSNSKCPYKVRYSSMLCHFLLLSAMCYYVFSVFLAVPAVLL